MPVEDSEGGHDGPNIVIVRRQRKAAITRRLGAIQRAMALGKSADVDRGLRELETCFSEFEAAHDLYHDALETVDEIDRSEIWFQEVERSYIEGVKAARDFLHKTGVLNNLVEPMAGAKVKLESDVQSDMSPGSDAASEVNDGSFECIVNMLQMPKVELDVFDGNPINFQSFQAVFDEIVHKRGDDDQIKLTRLLQYTTGQAKAAIKSCAVIGGSKGYQQAREILENRFGNPHLVSQRIMQDVKCGKSVSKPSELQQLADDLQMAQAALKSLDMESEIDNQRSILDILQRCKSYVGNKWKRKALDFKRQHSRYPDFSKFVDFICEVASEACDPVYGSDQSQGATGSVYKSGASGHSVYAMHAVGSSQGGTTAAARPCVVCQQLGHRVYQCEQFRGLAARERHELAKRNRLCFNCLQYGHAARVCQRQFTCRVPGCGLKHNTLIHIDTTDSNNGATSEVSVSMQSGCSSVCLPVVPVIINDEHEAFALLDSGSTNTFVSQRVANKLGLHGKDTNYRLNTLGQSTNVRGKVVTFDIVTPESCDFVRVKNAIVVPKIPATNTGKRVDVRDFPRLADLPIRQVDHKMPVDVIIGLDNPALIAPLEVRYAHESCDGLYATRTRLGWALNGPVSAEIGNEISTFHVSLEQQVENLWKLEACDEDMSGLSCNDKNVLDLWENEVSREGGHYFLPIPWKEERPQLPMNRHIAMHRLQNLENKIDRMGIREKYSESVENMFSQGYAERVPADELYLSDGSVWYLPHHAVLSESKPGKVRVVFDCAAKLSGVSLNNQCMQGPDLNNKLIDVLLRFRQFPYALTGDVEAMYYQVRIPEKDRNSLRFLWSVGGRVEDFRMTSHVFGGVWCSSSSTFALRRAVRDSGACSFVQNLVERNFYVDDLLCSVKTVDEAKAAISGCKAALQYGGFRLTKFLTNDPIVLNEIPGDDRAGEVKEITPDLHAKALGVRWDVAEDSFYYVRKQSLDDCGGNVDVTRRSMLREVSSMYDPLGLISPVVIKGRMLFQEATRLKLGWDDVVESHLCESWQSWLGDLVNLPSLRFSRCSIPSEFADGVTELHYFCDASQSAYGTCCYARSVNRLGQIHVSLLASKGRLAPIKTATIPRLELCACVEAVKLDSLIRRALDVPLLPSTYWSDSMIALSYIKNETRRFKVFVSNRVSIIREHSLSDQWHHIASGENPADILSRGCEVFSLSDFWKQGPDFLLTHKDQWSKPAVDVMIPPEDAEVLRDVSVCSTTIDSGSSPENPIDAMITHYSSFYRLCKAMCWWLRVKLHLMGKGKFKGPLTASELNDAQNMVLIHVQSQAYANELESLSRDGHVRNTSVISRLCPKLKNGLIVVGGRLSNAAMSDAARWPVILPRDNTVSRMIVRECHEESHVGIEWTLGKLRTKYWIVGARNLIKGVQRDCVTCKRLYAAPAVQKMADLPPERLLPGNAPFHYVGMDIFGPFLVKQGRSEVKRYGCVFTCFTTRAVHIERLVSLETDAFINGFMRFVARRGCPVKVWSDNGTNLVGAKAELTKSLKELDRQRVIRFTRRLMVEWVFNPPHASHHGGVWERMIRTIRKILVALLSGQCRLSDDALETFFCETENIVNSRPITKVSDDARDDAALTPNDLLLIRGNPSLPWGDFSLADIYKKQWRHVQFLANQFWKQWVRQYLPQLQSRQKWTKSKPNVQVGDIVLLVDECAPRGEWPMGIVVETNVGRDGLVRSCKLRTKSSIFVRPVTKIVLLEGLN